MLGPATDHRLKTAGGLDVLPGTEFGVSPLELDVPGQVGCRLAVLGLPEGCDRVLGLVQGLEAHAAPVIRHGCLIWIQACRLETGDSLAVLAQLEPRVSGIEPGRECLGTLGELPGQSVPDRGRLGESLGIKLERSQSREGLVGVPGDLVGGQSAIETAGLITLVVLLTADRQSEEHLVDQASLGELGQ